jgi:hypothetical protein
MTWFLAWAPRKSCAADCTTRIGLPWHSRFMLATIVRPTGRIARKRAQSAVNFVRFIFMDTTMRPNLNQHRQSFCPESWTKWRANPCEIVAVKISTRAAKCASDVESLCFILEQSDSELDVNIVHNENGSLTTAPEYAANTAASCALSAQAKPRFAVKRRPMNTAIHIAKRDRRTNAFGVAATPNNTAGLIEPILTIAKVMTNYDQNHPSLCSSHEQSEQPFQI